MLNDGLLRHGQTFGKHERIRNRQEINRVFDKGTRFSVRGMRMHVWRNGQAHTRAVFVTVRKYGNAVQRNRARRVVSEAWRLLKADLASGLDVVVIIYPFEDTLSVRQDQLKQLVRRSGLMN